MHGRQVEFGPLIADNEMHEPWLGSWADYVWDWDMRQVNVRDPRYNFHWRFENGREYHFSDMIMNPMQACVDFTVTDLHRAINIWCKHYVCA